jgi:hypothetical protein
MDDTPCQRYFLEPDQPLHRRYAALRAFFIDGLPLQAVAEQFNSTYHTIRSWVRDFRSACRAGQAPPFSPNHVWDGPFDSLTPGRRLNPTSRPTPTPANSVSHPGGGYAAAWRVSSSSSPCWRGWASTPW